MKKITCLNCKMKITGDDSFDEVARKNGWAKRGIYYVCPECEKPTKARNTRISKFSKRDIDDEQTISKYYD